MPRPKRPSRTAAPVSSTIFASVGAMPTRTRPVGRQGLRYVTCVVVVAQAFTPAFAQQPTFSSAARTVAVYATVTSADARLVTDLGRDQFTVEDNGKPQQLSLFANDIQPITVVLLLDRSGSMRANFELVEQA